MVKRNRAALLPTNLPQLQNLIKRDPPSYREEFLQQWRHYESSLAIFRLKPDAEAKEFQELVTFLAHVAPCYPKESAAFPQQIIDLLREYSLILMPDVRKALVQALVLLRNKQIIDSLTLLSLFFDLFRCRDKQLRDTLYKYIINDIRVANQKTKNNKLNKVLQNHMYKLLEQAEQGGDHAVCGKKAVEVCVELYKKRVWQDQKTVNVLAHACFSTIPRIAMMGVQFFLGADEVEDDSSDSEGEAPDLRALQHKQLVGKKTKSRTTQMNKAMAAIRKKERGKSKAESFNFSALHQLNDSQGFAERLYKRLTGSNMPYDARLLFIKLLARVLGIHKLILLQFFTYIINYLKPHQQDVTVILAATAQASHSLVPPDAVEPVLLAIANNFVVERVSSEVVCAGINSIREICARCPLAMNDTLLQDLTEYKTHRDKGVMMAARSLITLFRTVNPELLKKRDRGKEATMARKTFQALQFGEESNADLLNDVALLEEYEQLKLAHKSKKANKSNEDEEEEEEEEEDEDMSDIDNEEEWEIDSDAEEIEDDEDDEEIDEDEEEDEENAPQLVPITQSNILTTKILTSQDFARLKELQIRKQAHAKLQQQNKKAAPESMDVSDLFENSSDDDNAAGNGDEDMVMDQSDTENGNGEVVDESAILAFRKRAKQTYEERLASIQSGRDNREKKFGCKKKRSEGHSTTNKEKRKTKAFMMVVHQRTVKQKAKMSLRDKQIQLRQSKVKQRRMQKKH